ncbi:carboxypeptidase-like regulatory domain-containing protein [Clostridium sp.]|uniref:MSCRAMM family protein n=1 Tax=Clostridium sp. TaxID=1506 RepID=UPI0026255CBE|nr:carboxypeptidase-like regulatory domain-containing protein [Clostridium sp.]
MAIIKQDIYILGQSDKKTIQSVGEEIRLDLQLQPQPLNNTGKVTGTVIDESGNPITGSLIKLMDANYEPLLHAITGSDGTYTLDNVPAGTGYNIFATATGKALNQGTSFSIVVGQVVNKNFTLLDEPSAQLGLIAGDLYDNTTGLPINGAVISLYQVNPDDTEVLKAITYTNEYGQFVFRELDQGNYSIRVSALGYIGTTSTVNITQSGQIVPSLITIAQNPNASRGTVSGIITDNLNQPIVAADVVLYEVNPDESLTAIAFTKTNTAGVYLFINVPQGNYKVKSNQTENVNMP